MNVINNGNSFLLLKGCFTFAAEIKNEMNIMNMITDKKIVLFLIRNCLMPCLFFGQAERRYFLILWYMHCASRLLPRLLTGSTFSAWIIRLQPVLSRYPVILFRS